MKKGPNKLKLHTNDLLNSLKIKAFYAFLLFLTLNACKNDKTEIQQAADDYASAVTELEGARQDTASANERLRKAIQREKTSRDTLNDRMTKFQNQSPPQDTTTQDTTTQNTTKSKVTKK